MRSKQTIPINNGEGHVADPLDIRVIRCSLGGTDGQSGSQPEILKAKDHSESAPAMKVAGDGVIIEIIAVLIFKALFLWGIWACCFRQSQEAPVAGIPILEEVTHGTD